MSWPLPQDYNEAVQSPRVNFSDPELQGGAPALNALGLPLPCSGNFADVYEVRSPSGGRWAVKCFTREVAGLRERYAAISRHLREAHLPFVVDFTFLEEGIHVRGRWYPVLKMQWVEGLPFNDFVRQYADKPAMLESLLQIWVRMAARLRGAGIAHADLQHGNVLLVPGSTANSLALKLVDYDGTYVPALAGSESGEVGHPCYQHPGRSAERTWSAGVDRFPLLLIATALCAVKAGGRALWDKHDSGDNLLFREADLRAPVKSELFYELLKLPDERTVRLTQLVIDALKGGVESAPLLEELLPELLAAPAPKPAAVPAPPNVTLVPVTVSNPLAEAEAGSVWDLGGEAKPQPRRPRKHRVPLWAWGLAALSLLLVGAVALGGVAFYLTRKPANVSANSSTAVVTPRDEHTPSPPEPQGGKVSPADNPAAGPQATRPNHLINLAPDASVADLRRALKDELPAVKEKAVGLLAERGAEAEPAVSDLGDVLSGEKNPTKVRALAAIALGHLKEKAKPAAAALGEALKPTAPVEVRRGAAEALALMRYPANEEAIPAALEAIRKDRDPLVRQRAVWALFGLKDLGRFGADKLLAEVLDEAAPEMMMVRYDAARKLADGLRERAPDRTVGALLEMMQNKNLKVFNGTDAKVGGDARYMAAQALGWLGSKATRSPEVVKALRGAAADEDVRLRTEAQQALRALNIDPAAPQPARAEATPSKKEEARFVALFNGKDLSGWKDNARVRRHWSVEDGVLIAGGPAPASYLVTEKNGYRNFRLRVETMLSEGANSHVGFRGVRVFIRGASADSAKVAGSLSAGQKLLREATDCPPLKPGDWFTQEILADGKHVVVSINGTTILDYTDNGHLATQGPVDLMCEGGSPVKFRKIEIQELALTKPDGSPASDTKAEATVRDKARSAHPPSKTDEAKKAFEKASKDAEKRLLKDFDTALDRLASAKLSVNDRLKLRNAVKAEKTRFEQYGYIPWSAPMLPHRDRYLAAIKAGEKALIRAYAPLIDAQLRGKNKQMADRLLAERDAFRGEQIKVVARWRHVVDRVPRGTNAFYANGKINTIDGPSFWVITQQVLTMNWSDAKGQRIVFIDTCGIGADGTTYAGTNQGKKVRITGSLDGAE